MTAFGGCSVQISTIDAELPLVRHLLPHQIRTLGPHVDEVLISVNRKAGPANPEYDAFLNELVDRHDNVRWTEVDYSPEAVQAVSDHFFGGASYQVDDWKGTPIHAALQPLLAVRSPYLLHLDSDILLGGDYGSWFKAAISEIEYDPNLVFVNPLGGPPGPDPNRYQPAATRITLSDGAIGWRFVTVSTRICFALRSRLDERVHPLVPRAPDSLGERSRARLLGHANPTVLIERMYDDVLEAKGVYRVDLAGAAPGAWSLHLPWKPKALIDELDRVVAAVESGDVPDGQRGDVELNDSFVALGAPPSRRARGSALLKNIVSYQAGRVGRRGRTTS